MSVNISQFRNRIIGMLPGCPIPRIDQEIVNAIRNFCEDSLVFRKTIEGLSSAQTGFSFSFTFTFEVSASGEWYIAGIVLSQYSILTNLDPIIPIYCRINNVDTGLVRFDLDNDITILDGILTNGKKFYRCPSLTTVEIFPLQVGEANTIVLTLAMKPSIGVTAVHDDFYYMYLRAVEAMSLYLLQSVPGQSWSNPDLAILNYNVYLSELGKHKLRTAAGNMTGQMIATGGYI